MLCRRLVKVVLNTRSFSKTVIMTKPATAGEAMDIVSEVNRPHQAEIDEIIKRSGKDPESFTKEGKVAIYYDRSKKTFYNPTQEVNRDVSILGIQTFIDKYLPEQNGNIRILEAMAASGIRSIRYSKEIDGIKEIVANDFSENAVQSLKENCGINETNNVLPNLGDATILMTQIKQKFHVVDLDPYGSPTPFLESGMQCVEDGGMLLVTATDMAVLAGGNNPEACFSKYGSVSVKSKACQELALRILIHSVQSCAGRHGKFCEPLLSLKIDFYIRIFFRVHESPAKSKAVALNTSMFFQCTGCRMLHLQPLLVVKGPNHYYGSAKGPPVGPACSYCNSSFHMGGPIWSGLIHNKQFVGEMEAKLDLTKFEYLGTNRRIQGILRLVSEELEVPLLYDFSDLTAALKCSQVSIEKFRSAFLHLGYKISSSHTAPKVFKTDAPHEVILEILFALRKQQNRTSKEGTPAFNIEKNLGSKFTREISFELHPDANPPSRELGILRFQHNPTKFWGPGSRDSFDANKIRDNKIIKGDKTVIDSECDSAEAKRKKL